MAERERTTTTGQQNVPDLPAHTNIEEVTSYEVYDRDCNHIGSTTAIWNDRSNQPAFVGVKTTWLFGKTHVVPAQGAGMNHEKKAIRLPYAAEDIKNGPTYNPEDNLGPEDEEKIMSFFAGKGTALTARPGCAALGEPARERATAPTARGTESAREGTTIPLHEEQLKVGKREVEVGGVRLRKIVRTETVQQPVELKREEVVVERVPASETRAQPSAHAFTGEEIFIPLRREEAVIEKEARVREEVRARKTAGTERQEVSGEVRREDVEVEREGRRKAA